MRRQGPSGVIEPSKDCQAAVDAAVSGRFAGSARTADVGTAMGDKGAFLRAMAFNLAPGLFSEPGGDQADRAD